MKNYVFVENDKVYPLLQKNVRVIAINIYDYEVGSLNLLLCNIDELNQLLKEEDVIFIANKEEVKEKRSLDE